MVDQVGVIGSNGFNNQRHPPFNDGIKIRVNKLNLVKKKKKAVFKMPQCRVSLPSSSLTTRFACFCWFLL